MRLLFASITLFAFASSAEAFDEGEIRTLREAQSLVSTVPPGGLPTMNEQDIALLGEIRTLLGQIDPPSATEELAALRDSLQSIKDSQP